MEILEMPEEGQVGKLKMKMFRGTQSEKNHLEYTSDPGDYGRGEYWTSDYKFAENYGYVEEKFIEIGDIYFIPKSQLLQLIEQYQTCKIHLGVEVRINGAQKLTDYFKSKNYKGVLTYNYESFDIFGLCIFK